MLANGSGSTAASILPALSAAGIAGNGMLVTNFTESGEIPCSARTEAVSRYRMFFGALIADRASVQVGERLDRRVRHDVDALGARFHHRSLGEDVQVGLARGLGLDVGDVVAAGDVVLALDLCADHGVAAGGWGEVDVQPLLGEQALRTARRRSPRSPGPAPRPRSGRAFPPRAELPCSRCLSIRSRTPASRPRPAAPCCAHVWRSSLTLLARKESSADSDPPYRGSVSSINQPGRRPHEFAQTQTFLIIRYGDGQ